jgi:hypothetical protein
LKEEKDWQYGHKLWENGNTMKNISKYKLNIVISFILLYHQIIWLK